MRIKYNWVILAVIVILGLAIRLYGINLPLLESHQLRQVQTAMMARNLYDDDMTIFRTRLDVFGDRPGYIILEFPLIHGITALLYYPFGVHEAIGRLVSVAFSVGSMFLMYGLARQFLSRFGAFAALALYVFSPMNIFFSRAFMPESSMMFFIVGSIYFILKCLDRQTLSLYLTAIIFAALVSLTKPTACVIFVPILMAWFLKYKRKLFRRFDFWLFMFLTVTPFILWAAYAHYFNAIDPLPFGYGGSWIKIMVERGITEHWLSPKFYTFMGGSIILLLLTPLGFIGSATGVLCVGPGDKRKILYSWLGAIILYFYVVSGPNSGHIYYQLPLLPVAAIFFGFTAEWLLGKHDLIKEMFKKKSFIWLGTGLLLLTLVGHGVGYFKYFVYMYRNTMPYTLEACEIIEEHTPENGFVILNQPVVHPGVVAYYSHRRTWYFSMSQTSITELEKLRARGAATYVAIDTTYGSGVKATQENEAFWDYLNEKYNPIALTDHYLIFDLRVPKDRR